MDWKDDLVSPLRVYSITSDAIDLALTDIDKYERTRNPDLVKVLPGRTALSAMIKALPFSVMASIDAAGLMSAVRVQCFRLAVTALEHEGLALMPSQKVALADGREHITWSESEFQRAGELLGLDGIYEIGEVIYRRARQGKARRGGVRYTPPPFLATARVENELLRAELLETNKATLSSE